MGTSYDYALAKAETGLHKFLERDCRTASEWERAAVCYLKTLTPGLIDEHLTPDAPFPHLAVDNFREVITKEIERLWNDHFGGAAFVWDLNYGARDGSCLSFDLAVRKSELTELWDRAVKRFWVKRAAYLEALRTEPLRAELAAARKNVRKLYAKRSDPEPLFLNRASWLKDRLRERSWNKHDLARHGGPDHKTVQKVLEGLPVREDVLQKVADALSKKHGTVTVLDIPQD